MSGSPFSAVLRELSVSIVSSKAHEDLVDGKRNQRNTCQPFDRAGDRFEKTRPALDEAHQAFAQQDRDYSRIDCILCRSGSAAKIGIALKSG